MKFMFLGGLSGENDLDTMYDVTITEPFYSFSPYKTLKVVLNQIVLV